MNRTEQMAQAIEEITSQLQNASELNTALSGCLQTVIRALDSEAGTIWILKEGTEQIVPVISLGPVDISDITITLGQGIAGTVVRDGEAIIAADVNKDSRFSHSVDEKSGFLTRSILCAPILGKDEPLGCVQVINKKDGEAYDQADLGLCQKLAALTSAAILKKNTSAMDALRPVK